MLFWGKKKPLSEKNFKTGLIEIPLENSGEITASIVFVHGLGADRRQTWHYQQAKQSDYNQDDFWPKWLGDDLPGFKVWLFGYEAKKFFLEKGKASSRYDIAKNLLGYLKAKKLEQYPLWFICHSLGGLVVKQMLRVAQDSKEPILDQVKGVVFLATPHVGSDLAKLGEIARIISFNSLQVTKSVKELESHNAGLRELDDWYRKKAEPLRILTLPFYEMYDTWGCKVVDEDSANPKVNNQEECIPVEADHIEIARCRDRESLVYLNIKNFIEDNSEKSSLFQSPKLSQINQQTRQEEIWVQRNQENEEDNQNYQWTHPDLYKQLKKLNFTDECNQVRHYIQNQITIGSFLLCGTKKKGIDILLERLYDQQTYYPIEIDLGGNEGINEELILNKIAQKLEIEAEGKADKVFEKIIEANQEQNILLVLKSIDKILPQDVSNILTNFWGELIRKIEEEGILEKTIVSKSLFLFLVDYQNRYYQTEFSFPFANKLFPDNFTEEDIGNWIEQVRIEWGTNQCDDLSLDCTKAQSIFQESEGMPYQVYRAIYDYFDLAWRQSIFVQKYGM
ncbi:MAG: esterase/lipase family protein [Crocosphaera sp.]